MEIRSMIRELGNGGLWAVTEVALMPCTRSVRLRARARWDPVVALARTLEFNGLRSFLRRAGGMMGWATA
jgi:hypothetical protein